MCRILVVVMGLIAASIVATAAPTPAANASIGVWFCSNGLCDAGSCSLTNKFQAGSCVPNPDGSQTFIVPQCLSNPAPDQLCVPTRSYGYSNVVSPSDCSPATAVQLHTPCGICIPGGPFGKSYIVKGCQLTSTQATVSYNCNDGCSSCENSITVGPTCMEAVGQIVAISDYPKPCSELISYVTYSDSACTTPIIPLSYYAASLSLCNGYPYQSNARANLFKCLS